MFASFSISLHVGKNEEIGEFDLAASIGVARLGSVRSGAAGGVTRSPR